jgi:tight adherence protein B
MSRAAVLAFGAGATGVLGAWEAMAAVERTRVAAWIGRAVEPLIRAGREGRAPTRPEQRRLVLLCAAALAAAGWLVGGAGLGVLAAVGGPGLATAAVRARRRRYARELRRGAAAAARALADAVGAGHSIRGAVAAAGEGTPGPAGRELRTTAHALAFGTPTAAALDGLRRRAADPAWDTIVAGILLQRDAGGDLAGLLRGQAAALEAADRLERDAKAATAQARFTARLVLLLPLGAALVAELAGPGLVAGILDHPLSAWLVAMAAVLQAVALAAIARLARAGPGTGAPPRRETAGGDEIGARRPRETAGGDEIGARRRRETAGGDEIGARRRRETAGGDEIGARRRRGTDGAGR